MKLTCIKTDKKNKQHVNLVPFESFMERVQEDNYFEDVDALRTFVRYAESWSIFERMHRLPVIYPSAVMKTNKEGNLIAQQFNGLFTLTISPLKDEEEAEAVKRMTAILPSTMLSLLGSSGRSLKVIVRACRPDGSLPQTEEGMEAFCKQVYPILCGLYEPLVTMTQTADVLQVAPAIRGEGQPSWMTGFRMTADQHPYCNTEATPLLIPDGITMSEKGKVTLADTQENARKQSSRTRKNSFP